MNKRKSLITIVIVLCATILTAIPCYAGASCFSQTRDLVSDIPDVFPSKNNVIYKTQGMAAGSQYIYSIKINSENSMAAVFRTNISKKTTTLLKNADTDKTYNTYMGHANDVALCGIDGYTNLYVVDSAAKNQLVKIEINNSNGTYRKKATYRTFVDNKSNPIAMSSVAVLEQTNDYITFLFRQSQKVNNYGSANTFHIGTVGLRAGSGDIYCKRVFTINRNSAYIGGKLTDLTGYIGQGIEYDNNRLYLPLSGPSTNKPNVILIYGNILAAKDSNGCPNLKASTTSFKAATTTYAHQYEMEGCAISGGKMYMNFSRIKQHPVNKWDTSTPICYYDDFNTGISLFPVSKVTLNSKTVTLNTGKTASLTPAVTPSNATDKSVVWKSDNTAVATVTSNGVVKGINAGTATITVTTKDSGKEASCKITVKQPMTSLALNTSVVTIPRGANTTLKPVIAPANTSNKAVTWKSSNANIATVTSNGVVTAKATSGKTTIICTAQDGSGKSAKCTVYIGPKVKGITLSKTSMTLGLNKTYTLKATLNPTTAANTTVFWSSSNKSIATVSKDGVVKGLKKGTVTITAETQDGGKKATCKITVK